jgi:acetyl-CoA C-acetyltransferase
MPRPVIVAGARTPIGKLLGALASLTAGGGTGAAGLCGGGGQGDALILRVPAAR